MMHTGERFNSLSHLFATCAVACYAAVLLPQALKQVDSGAAAGLGLFVLAAVLTYAASTAFHIARGKARPLLERIDNAMIFVLIAGSYTPFALASPRHDVNLCLLALVWTLALVASCRALVQNGPPNLLWYVGLGWGCIAAAFPVALRTSNGSLTMLLLGAFAYSGGTIFYMNRMGWRHAHGTWHLCVLGGTIAHFAAVSYLIS